MTSTSFVKAGVFLFDILPVTLVASLAFTAGFFNVIVKLNDLVKSACFPTVFFVIVNLYFVVSL